MAFQPWRKDELEEFVEYSRAAAHRVGTVLSLGGVRGPDPRDPPREVQWRVDAIRPGQVILNGMAHENGEFVWVELGEDSYRVPLLKVVAVERDAVVLAPMARLLWERVRPSPLGD